MPTFKAGKGADAHLLRGELSARGLAATVEERAGEIHVDVADETNPVRVQEVMCDHKRAQCIRRVKAAKPGTAELRDAVADALEALL